MKLQLDRKSPVPLYHQLAESLRWRISNGKLAAGQRLPSLRAAAAELGVNLHTVRAAYEELAQEGLLESDGARGTRVLARTPATTGSDRELEQLVHSFIHEGHRRFGLTPEELARQVMEMTSDRLPIAVSVVECSLAQCRDHVEELYRSFGVEAEPWPLDRNEEPPPGLLVATYFHYSEVVRRWPNRRDDMVFVAVRPETRLAEELRQRFPEARRLLACELDEVRAANLAADLEAVLGGGEWRIEPFASSCPGEVVEQLVVGQQQEATPVCYAPRAWAELDPAARSSPWSMRVRYLIEEESLQAVAQRLRPRTCSEQLSKA